MSSKRVIARGLPVRIGRLALSFLPLLCWAQGGDTGKIRTLIGTYAESIGAADTALAAKIWSTTPDVSFIHPQGEEHGWDQIKSNVYEKLMGGLFSERRLTARDIEIHTDGNAAWSQFHWVFVAKLRSDGSPVKTEGRETQIYRKIGGQWRIVHVHYSEMPRPPQ